MMKRISAFLIVAFVLAGKILALADNDFPLLSPNDINGGNIIRAEYYSGDALWGIINGGADIYLEYGFDKLLLQEIEWKGINFRVEFYRMNDPEAAFGIFSVSHFKCGKRDTLSKFVCITQYQVQSALGRFYVSIANDKGNKEAETLTINLFEKVLAKSKEKLFEIPERFLKSEFSSQIKNLKVIKGALGFQNGFPIWSDKFEQFSKYVVYLLPIEAGEEYSYYAISKFASNSDMKKFITQSSEAKLYRTKQVTEKELLFIETNTVGSKEEKIFLE